jgi:hypothetical protein
MARIAKRAFDILLPRLNRAEAGVVFAAGNYVRRTGVVPAKLQAARLPGGSIGVHAAAADGSESLCGLSLVSPSKTNEAAVHYSGTAAKAAESVTCKFCAARLIAAGVIGADSLPSSMPAASREYARDYGSRTAEAELAAIEQRAADAKRAAERPKRKTTARKTRAAKRG